LDAIPVKVRPDKPLVITAAEKEKADELKKYAVEVYDNGVVLGLSGAFMSEALLREIVGITLMTPATADIPDPEAAVSIINVINDYYKLQIDTQPLLEQAEKIKEQLALIAKQQAALQQPKTPPPRRAKEGYI